MVFLLRLHTLFNDYYDVDELAQMVHSIHAAESGNLLYGPYGKAVNFTFNITLKIFGQYNWRALHLLAIIIILLSSIGIYFIVKNTIREERAALFSAFFYSVFVSIGYKDIYPLTSEIIFNLFISFSFASLTHALFSSSKLAYRIGSALISVFFFYLVFHSKMHARFHLFLLIAVIPILQKTGKRKLGSLLVMLVLGIVLFFIIDFVKPGIIAYFKSMLNESLAYILSEKLTVGFVLYRIFTTSIILTVSQFPVWYFAIKYFKMEKGKVFTTKNNLLIAFFIINFIPATLTLRFFPHYFIQPLLPASILAGIYFSRRLEINEKITKPFTRYLFIMILVVVISSFTFVTLKHIKPYIRINLHMFWPHSGLIDTINWLKADGAKGKKIFVWGDAAEIYYYTQTSHGGGPLWHSVFAKNYLTLKHHNPVNYDYSPEFYLIDIIERNKMLYFIDTQPNGYSDFERFPLAEFTELNKYVQKNYYVAAICNKIIIYKRKLN